MGTELESTFLVSLNEAFARNHYQFVHSLGVVIPRASPLSL